MDLANFWIAETQSTLPFHSNLSIWVPPLPVPPLSEKSNHLAVNPSCELFGLLETQSTLPFHHYSIDMGATLTRATT